ncbi:hypothetical protein BD626DRAFT_490282 [Schizophyllum amplum]|uniref:UBX domain-containing protein n=1 Tax=Schizophyllum amplum TaxID=97359 RepID=A0A550CJA9_9AGAR|nr:hypothetical protein BD626DRAFT_490282 [Auriculariopsis ampla]
MEASPPAVPSKDPAPSPGSLLHDFKVYKPSDWSHLRPPPPPPESYFTPSPADVKAAQATLSARTHALTDRPLELKAVRDERERAKRDRWPNTTIRVRFPDRTQLEKIFPSTSRIKAVYAFVRERLRDDVKPIKFILYQPPKIEFKNSDPNVRDKSLAELHLAPSSVLMLRFEDESLNHATTPAPLLSEVLALAEDLPAPPNYEQPAPAPSSSTEGPPPALPKPSGSGEKKIPKWLAAGLKKK